MNNKNTLDAPVYLEKQGVFKTLGRYGLGKVKSFSEQFGQVGKKTSRLFDRALGMFKGEKSSQVVDSNQKRSLSYVEMVQNKIKQADRVGEKFVVDNENELYDRVEGLLGDISLRGVDLAKKSLEIIELFKRELVNRLREFMNEGGAEEFVENRLSDEILSGESPIFQLIETEGHLELVSSNFIRGASGYRKGKGDHDNNKIDNLAGAINSEGNGRFFNAEKASEKLAKHRSTLTEQLISAVEAGSNGKVDQADLYEIGGMSANEALEMLRQVLNRRVERKQFTKETRQWIEDSINIFKPASDETFTEYIERRFMKGGRLPSIYNDVINVVKIFNKIQNKKNNNKKEVIDRQMIGEMPAEKVFDVLKVNKSVRENDGIKSILNNDIKPLKGESLRRYFYRLVAFKKGCLKKDETVDEEKLRNDPDFKNTVQLLVDIIPPMNRRMLFKDDVGYYNPHKTRSNDLKYLGLRNKGLINRINNQYTRSS